MTYISPAAFSWKLRSWALVAALFFPPAARAAERSLVELSREMRARKANSSGTTPTYTNDDLFSGRVPAPGAQDATSRQAPPPAPYVRPLTLSGTFSTGFYSSFTRGGGNQDQKVRFAPLTAQFELNGFYATPDLIDYWLQPELTLGPQATDAGFDGGNGLRSRITFLRRRAFPLTLRYSNVQLKDIYFGSLTQVSSFTRNSRNADLSLSTELKHAGLPTTSIEWGKGSVRSDSGIDVIPDYRSRTNRLNVDSKYERWGWDFQGFARRQQQTSDLFIPSHGAVAASLLQQRVTQVQGSAQRRFPWDSQLYLEAGNQGTKTLLLERPIDLSTQYGSANLRLGTSRRWKTTLRAGYTSNLSSLLLTQLVGQIDSIGSLAPPEEVVRNFQRRTSYLNLNALTSAELNYGFGVYASADRTAVLTARESGLRSAYLTTAGGITYTKGFSRGSFSGQYGRTLGHGSVTGSEGRIDGHNYALSSQLNAAERLRLDFSVRGTGQRVRSLQPARENSFSSDASANVRVISELYTRFGGGWQRSSFTNAGRDFELKGYTAQLGIEHPRLQINGSLNSNAGNSLQILGQQFDGLGVEQIFTPLRVVPSRIQGWNISLHANPLSRVEITGVWTRSRQHLDGVISNEFRVMDVHLTYHFRKVQLEAGYLRSFQLFSSYLATYPATTRGRFYIRIVRKARIL